MSKPKLRSVNTKFWNDPLIENLSSNEKLLFLYLLTNPLTNILGIYEITIKRISYDTGLTFEIISKALKGFEKIKKVFYIDNYIILSNFSKNQKMNENMFKGAIKLFNELPTSIKNIVLNNKLKGFERILKASEDFEKEEREIESEIEVEIESKIEDKSSLSFQEALILVKVFYKNLPEKLRDKYSKERKNWIDSLEKCIRLDKYTPEQIERIIIYFRNDEFWSSNFISPVKLRKLNKDGIKYIDFFWNQLESKSKFKNNKSHVNEVSETHDPPPHLRKEN